MTKKIFLGALLSVGVATFFPIFAETVQSVSASLPGPVNSGTPAQKPPVNVPAATPSRTASTLPNPLNTYNGAELSAGVAPETAGKVITLTETWKLVGQKHFKVRVADNVGKGAKSALIDLPVTAVFFQNNETHIIGVGQTKKDAIAMSQTQQEMFYAKAGDTLSDTLTRWASEVGYHIHWLSEHDFRLAYSYEFYGPLVNKKGALDQILGSFSSTDYSVKAVITKNNVILIKDNEYSPSVIAGF